MRNKALEDILVGTIGIATIVAPFVPRPVHAGDVVNLVEVSFVTSADSDGDGLTNSEEENWDGDPAYDPFHPVTNPFGTDTDKDNPDTDLDGIMDGWEAGASIGDPINPDKPGMGALNTLRGYSGRIRPITQGNSDNAFFARFLLGNRVVYQEGSSMYLKNLRFMSDDRVLLQTGLGDDYKQFGSGKLGVFIYYHDLSDGKIYKINRRNLNVTQAVPGPFQPDLGYNLRNPVIVGSAYPDRDTAEVKTTGNVYLVAEADVPDATHPSIVAFQLQTSGLGIGNSNGDDPITVTTHPGKMMMPVVSPDGDKIAVTEVDVDVSGQTKLWAYDDLQAVLAGGTPYGDAPNPRGLQVAFTTDGTAIPASYGLGSIILYFNLDQNNAPFDPSNPDYSAMDFDVFMVALARNNQEPPRYNTIGPRVAVVSPGNQLASDVRAGIVAIADDTLMDSTGTFNLYRASTMAGFPIHDGMAADLFNGYVDGTGMALEGNKHSHVIASTEEAWTAQPNLDPATAEAGSALTLRRQLLPAGLMVAGATAEGTPALRVRLYYNIGELLIQDATGDDVLYDDRTFDPVYEASEGNVAFASGSVVARNPLSATNPVGWVDVLVSHQSNIAFKVDPLKALLQPTGISSEQWEGYR